MPFQTATCYLHSSHLPADLRKNLVGQELEVERLSISAESTQLLLRVDLTHWLFEDADELVPCLSGLFDQQYGYQATLSVTTMSGASFSCALSPVGAFPDTSSVPAAQASGAIKTEIDIFLLTEQIKDASLLFDIRGVSTQQWETQPWLISLTQRKRLSVPALEAAVSCSHTIDVEYPSYSQYQVSEIGARICSPTCIAMLLGVGTSIAPSPEQVAALAYCRPHDLYGVWPYAIYAASRLGRLGLLSFFGSWREAQLLLDRSQAIVASIRYGRGELSAAALERATSKPEGHLVLLRGYTPKQVLVLDPAAKDPAAVARHYDRDEFEHVWIERSGMGYVLL